MFRSGTHSFGVGAFFIAGRRVEDRYLSHSSHHTQVPVPVTKPKNLGHNKALA